MAVTPVQTEQAYSGGEPIGIAVLVGCGMLSVISVLGLLVILGVSAVRSRHSSDEVPFVRTHIAIYFFSLLICNLAQGVGALLNIPWIVENRVYTGTLCTAQATIEQVGNIGTAIFSFVIAADTFSLLFLRHQWSDRTRYAVLVASWNLLVIDMCINNFIVADSEENGPYQGIAGYWCWIAPAYSTRGYITEYLFMFSSAGFSFILYSLVFFRLRGNITLSEGYRVYFHRRPKVRMGRTSTGTYIMTDDQRVESYLTVAAKQMLWYPIAYTVLVLPVGTTRFYTTSGASVPFIITIFTAALLMLSGFVNTVLFCTTRSVLPGDWRQRFSRGTVLDGRRGDVTMSSWGNSESRRTETGTRKGAGRASFVIDISVEKDIEIKYDDEPSRSSLKYSTPVSLATPLRAYGGRKRADAYSHHIRQPSYPPLRGKRKDVCLEGEGEDEDRDPNEGVPLASKASTVDDTMLHHPVDAPRRHEGGMSEPAMSLAPVYPLSTAHSVDIDFRRSWSPPLLTFGDAVNYHRPSRLSGDFGSNGGGISWTGYNGQLPQTTHSGIYHPPGGEYSSSAAYPSTGSRRPAGY